MKVTTFLSGRVVVRFGDITKESVDAIVNAANSTLLGGGGVDGAIHRVGGPEILAECRKIRRELYPDGLPTGEAVLTTAGKLPARSVIHTVGPIYSGSEHDAELLAACYVNSIRLGAKHSYRSIAFPAVSTGVYGYPKDKAAAIASLAIADTLRDIEHIEVRLLFHSPADMKIFLDHCEFPD
jgi:O-acetyl-ADP-ribose deacetylase (regulator of RNase III)